MQATINKMIEEQFGTGKISKKVWLVMTTDRENLAGEPVDKEGYFHPAVMLEGIHGETSADALANFRRCFNTQRVYGVVETIEEAKKLMPDATIIDWNGKFIQK
jgi:hypothetical protein